MGKGYHFWGAPGNSLDNMGSLSWFIGIFYNFINPNPMKKKTWHPCIFQPQFCHHFFVIFFQQKNPGEEYGENGVEACQRQCWGYGPCTVPRSLVGKWCNLGVTCFRVVLGGGNSNIPYGST